MDDLVRWFGEHLDEDERIARAATHHEDYGVWTAKSFKQQERLGRDRWALFDAVDDCVVSDVDAEGTEPEGVAQHIANWDPARVLCEVDAKRRLLDDYVVTARIRDEAAARIKAAGDHPDAKDLETWDRAQREAAILEGPVRLAALPLAVRPGYREDWRP
ncbi:DUF6221 family protein [Streptomyces mirabilis]|uniref:DUF6221 family protein n=1 Tax=Streptomyces mirabilis TaxID=68239 RepID=UPI00369257A5